MKKRILLILGTFFIATSIYYLYKKTALPQSPFKKYASLIPGTYRVGFTNLDTESTNIPLTITGTIPSWLNGTLYRNGPGKFTTTTSWVSNWFDGLAMINAFTINHGTIAYTNCLLKGNDYEFMRTTGRMTYAGFVQDPCQSLFKTITAWFTPADTAPQLPNANVNITTYDNRLVALTETPLPLEFDAKTLTTVGGFNYTDHLPKKDIHDTAHPHYDPITKEHLGYFTKFGRSSTLNLYGISDGSTQRRIIGSYDTEHASYMHSFAITPHYAIFAAIPLVINLWHLITGSAFIKAFDWKPELGTRFIVFNRHTGALVGVFHGEPFFAFHVINAFEKDELIHVDIVTYNNADAVVHESLFDAILSPQPEINPTTGIVKRYTIDHTLPTVSAKMLSQQRIELPRINYAYNGKDYTYLYAFTHSFGQAHPYVADTLIKMNIKTGEITRWSSDNCFPGEGVFIPNPGGTQEDDGVVVSIILDASRAVSFLIILDAHTFTELARATLTHHIPFGIHGQFFASSSSLFTTA